MGSASGDSDEDYSSVSEDGSESGVCVCASPLIKSTAVAYRGGGGGGGGDNW